jgi:arylsulfatase A-like enzyme
MSDDMRAELGAYGSSHMHTPHLDHFGASGTVFDRAYIAVSVCMPSRTAGLTSRRPDTTRNYELRGAAEYHRNVVNATTIPQFFKERGFVTYGCGKLFHYMPAEEVAYSWDSASPSGLCSGGWSTHYFNPKSGSPSGSLDSCLPNVTDDELCTGQMTVGTLKTLEYIVAARKNGTLEKDR